MPNAHQEPAVYVVKGSVRRGADTDGAGRMLTIEPDAEVVLSVAARVGLIGALDRKQFIDWNGFPATSDRIDAPKQA